MSNLTLSNEDIYENIETVVDILCDQGLSFTAYNVTQIIRSAGVFVNHAKVREWFREFIVPVNYKKVNVLVGDARNEAVLYTTLNIRLAPDTVIYSELQDVAEAVALYHEWFEETYHFELPTPSTNECASETKAEAEVEPELVLVIQVPGSDAIKLPMTEEGLLKLLRGELGELGNLADACTCKKEHCRG